MARGVTQARTADLAEVGDAEHEADGVEDVGLSAPVQAGHGVELGVPAGDDRPVRVRLEAIEDDLGDVHLCRHADTLRPRFERGQGRTGQRVVERGQWAGQWEGREVGTPVSKASARD